jgi:hypothetical protein
VPSASLDRLIRAGVRSIWVIHPEIRVIPIFRADGSGSRLRSGEDVVPDFRCPVDTLFPAVQPADPPAAPTA